MVVRLRSARNTKPYFADVCEIMIPQPDTVRRENKAGSRKGASGKAAGSVVHEEWREGERRNVAGRKGSPSVPEPQSVFSMASQEGER